MPPISLAKFDFERRAREDGFAAIAGIDEVGRGCLAGSVVAAAVIFGDEGSIPDGIDDSKKLPASRREELAEAIRESAVAIAIGEIGPAEVDRINILEATKKAMLSAVGKLDPPADFLLIDAVNLDGCSLPQKSIIKGDSASVSIAAASIVAKVYRDSAMRMLDEDYPQYGFARNVGYGTAEHLEAIRLHGPCPHHRMTFRGVNQLTLNLE